MGVGLKSTMTVHATLVPNEFIDTCMTAANGEYVKVYLYLLRHAGENVEISEIADALNHTEADVKRALEFWRRAGVLGAGDTEDAAKAPDAGKTSGAADAGNAPGSFAARGGEAAASEAAAAAETAEISGKTAPAGAEFSVPAPLPDPSVGGEERMRRLSGDEDFSTLLYVAQQYLGKMFTSMECEKFAYFYDVLHMSGELLEYLAEYCAQNGHTNIRYIEKVALNWYQLGISTRDAAKDYTVRFSANTLAVMKTFGLTGRNPATAELDWMKKWFYTYGFDRTLVIEACNRTVKATQSPSFQYADKILTDWKNSGVKGLKDVEELDQARRSSKTRPGRKEPAKRPASNNRFHNFEERSYDYEDSVWEGIRKRQEKGGASDGTQ